MDSPVKSDLKTAAACPGHQIGDVFDVTYARIAVLRIKALIEQNRAAVCAEHLFRIQYTPRAFHNQILAFYTFLCPKSIEKI